MGDGTLPNNDRCSGGKDGETSKGHHPRVANLAHNSSTEVGEGRWGNRNQQSDFQNAGKLDLRHDEIGPKDTDQSHDDKCRATVQQRCAGGRQ